MPDQHTQDGSGPARPGDADATHQERAGGQLDPRPTASPFSSQDTSSERLASPSGEPAPIGETIRLARRRHGLTLEQLASRCGCAKSYLSAIETGRRGAPSEALLGRLESALFVPRGELVRLAAWSRMPETVRDEVSRRARSKGQDAALRRLREIMGQCPRQFPGHSHDQPQGETQDQTQDAGASPLDAAYRSGELRRLIDVIDPEEAGQGRGIAGSGIPGSGIAGSGIAGSVPIDLPFQVPLINKVSAGYPTGFTDMGYPARVADDYVRCPDLRDPDAFAARVVGDSMEPDYREGDIVVFSPARAIDDGDDCFVRLTPDVSDHGDVESTFKRVYFEREASGTGSAGHGNAGHGHAGDRPCRRIRLQPINSRYRPRVFAREDIAGLYRAVQVMRSV